MEATLGKSPVGMVTHLCILALFLSTDAVFSKAASEAGEVKSKRFYTFERKNDFFEVSFLQPGLVLWASGLCSW